MATQTLITGEQFDQLPEEEVQHWELLDGELIPVSSANPEHSSLLVILSSVLHAFCVRTQIGKVLVEVDFAFGPDRRLRPDIAILSWQQWSSLDRRKLPIASPPLVAIELISPSESATAVEQKVRAYLSGGVSVVVLLYPETQSANLRTRGLSLILESHEHLTLDALPGWRLNLATLFAEE